MTLETSHPEIYKLSKPTMDTYSFPVQLIIAHGNGTVVHSLNLNDFMNVDGPDEVPMDGEEMR